MELRDAIKFLRGELGITQTELANALHVNMSTVSRWELGKSSPNPTVSATLMEYARTRSASGTCRANLKRALSEAAKQKLDLCGNNLYSVEHASLRQLIDDASFPIYVCDLETYDLLYINRKTEELLGGSIDQLASRKCYKSLCQHDAPCEFCRKEQLVEDRFTNFDVFRPADNAFYRIQAKLVQWNGRRAQVRYINDMASSVSVSAQKERELAYTALLRVKRETSVTAIATAHYNLTRNTVSDVVCRQDDFKSTLSSGSIDSVLEALRNNPFSDDERRKLESVHDREAMMQQFYAGRTHISVKHYIKSRNRYYEGTFDLMQNPTTYDIEAFAALWDITDATMTGDIVDRLLGIDYETITTIDSETGEAHPFIGHHIDGLIAEQTVSGNEAGVEAYLRKYCADDDVESVVRGTSLPYIREQLKDKPYYHIAYSFRNGERVQYKRAVYTYLDRLQTIILCAIQDLTDLHALENRKRDQLSEALKTLQEKGGMDLARYDLKTKAFYNNSRMATMLGYGEVVENVPDEFIEKGLVAPDFVDEYRRFFDNLRAGEAGVITVPCRVADGSFHWLRLDAQLLYGMDGKPYQAILAFKDVDEEREHAAVYKKWRQSLDRKQPGEYTLFRDNLSKGTSFNRVEGSLLGRERLNYALQTFNERARDYAARFVHLDDMDAYLALINSENLLAGYYRGTRMASLDFRDRVGDEEYRWLRVTVEMAQYPESTDVELFMMFERLPKPAAEPEPVPAQDSAFDNTGVILVKYDRRSRRFIYDPAISEHIAGNYDERPIWEIFMSDNVADVQDIKAFRQLVHGLARQPGRTSAGMELMLKTPSKANHWFIVNVYRQTDAQNGTVGVIIAFQDANEDVLARRKLAFQAEHDGLTGLYNRVPFLKLVTQAVCKRPANAYILLCGDINDFRAFNERYGREEGDNLLRFTAEKLLAFAKSKNGFAGRMSSDIFALLLPNAPGALEQTEEIIQSCFKGYPLNARIAGRAGAYIVSDSGMKAESMLDRVMTAKDSIRGKPDVQLAVYDDGMNEKRRREDRMVERMEAALAGGEFAVYMQPQFHHATGRIVGAEALARWVDPDYGVILPGEFIPVFEQTGFISRLDEYIWNSTAEHMSAWIARANELVPVSVNVSREDVNDPLLCERLLAIVEKHNIPARLFRLEIAEGLFAENPKRLATVVEGLHKAGFLVEMDDFGSGYSSLNVLKDVPVDMLKLDMRFFSDADKLGRGGTIINAVLRMSRWLGIPVIAEGVELREQADFLLSVGCSTIQGYLYERPMPVADFEKLLAANGWDRSIPHNPVSTRLDTRDFWNPFSADSQLFHNYIGPAVIFEYHAGEYEIVRMNKRFIDAMRISEYVMLPATGLVHFCDADKPKVRKAVLDAIYSDDDVKTDLKCVRDDGSEPLFHVTLRTIAKSADRALIFAAVDA